MVAKKYTDLASENLITEAGACAADKIEKGFGYKVSHFKGTQFDAQFFENVKGVIKPAFTFERGVPGGGNINLYRNDETTFLYDPRAGLVSDIAKRDQNTPEVQAARKYAQSVFSDIAATCVAKQPTQQRPDVVDGVRNFFRFGR